MKIVEVITSAPNFSTIKAVAESVEAEDFRSTPPDDNGEQFLRLLVSDDKLQRTLDLLQSALATQTGSHILVLPVETALPPPPEAEGKKEDEATATREALYAEVERSSALSTNYLILITLSTIVAAIGMIENSVSAVIGAMVIAPLLGPNVALAFGSSLGDLKLMRKAAFSLLAGISLAIALSALIGLVWPFPLNSHELLSRTTPNYEAIALALASGAAAALSLTTGLSSVLVGVMVAVALLPPASALGLFLGAHEFAFASAAALLLAVNVVCVNLACKLVFLAKNIRPRTWVEKERAKRSTLIYFIVWGVTLGLLILIIFFRNKTLHG